MIEKIVSKRDIIYYLQSYKRAIQNIASQIVHLYFEDGKIKFEYPVSSVKYETIKRKVNRVRDFNSLIEEGYPEKIVKSIAITELVEFWLYNEKIGLSDLERECIFWFYINHDFERYRKASSSNSYKSPFLSIHFIDNKSKKMYKTLSMSEIAKRLNIKKSDVRRSIDRAIRKILKYNNE